VKKKEGERIPLKIGERREYGKGPPKGVSTDREKQKVNKQATQRMCRKERGCGPGRRKRERGACKEQS